MANIKRWLKALLWLWGGKGKLVHVWWVQTGADTTKISRELPSKDRKQTIPEL